MKDEAAFKKHFKASVRAQGGFSISLSAPVFPGIPDLYCVMPGYIPVLLEAKFLKDVNDEFNRMPKFTALQEKFIKDCNNVLYGSAWGLVGHKWNGHYWAHLCTPGNKVSHISRTYSVSISKHSEMFNVIKLFELYVPKLNYEYKPLLTKDWQPDSVEVSHAIGETVADETKDALA